MKHLRYLLMAALVAMPLTACDEDDDTTTTPVVTPPAVGTVSGTVTVESTGLAGVTVSLVGATSQSATTSSSGAYSFASVEEGSYGVALSGLPADVSFATTSGTTAITTDGQTVTVDFSGSYIRTSSIAGQVMADGNGLAGVAVTATGTEGVKSAVSDNAGNFSFSGLRADDYTVAMTAPAGYTFTTASQVVTVGTGEAKIAGFFGTEIVTVDPVTASVVIKSITFFNGVVETQVNPAAVVGQINVTLEIDPGQNDLTKISLLLAGTEIASQTLTNAVASDNVREMANGIIQVTFAYNTAAFSATTGAVTHTNGDYALSATLGLDNALSTSVSTSITLTFANLDNLIGAVTPTASLIGGAGSTNAGALFYGGGAITATVLPVIYSGRTIATVTTGFTAGAIAVAGAVVTDLVAPWANAHTAAGYASPAVVGVGNEYLVIAAATYSDGSTFGAANGGVAFPAATATVPAGIAMTGGSQFLVDRAVPLAAALILPSQNGTANICCSANWVTSAYAPVAGYTLAADNAGSSIGGVTGQIFAGPVGSSIATIAGGTAITTIADAGLSATGLVNTLYRMAHFETDLFGQSNTPIQMTAAAPNTLTTFGIDDVAPGQTVTGQADQVINPVPGALSIWTFALTDDRAGFGTTQVRAQESRLIPAGTTYPVYGASAATGGYFNYAAAVVGAANGATNTGDAFGYYEFTGQGIDQAGNPVGTLVTRRTLIDGTNPVAQNVQIPGVLTGGASTTFTAPVTDDLDLVTVDFDFSFGANAAAATGFFPFVDPASTDRNVGTAWDATLTTAVNATTTNPFVASMEKTAVAGGAPIAGPVITTGQYVRVSAIDAAGNQSAAQVNNFALGTVAAVTGNGTLGYAANAGLATFNIATVPGTAAATNLCNDQGTTACAAADAQSIAVTVTTTGPAGTYAPPFAGGYVYLFVNNPVAGGFDDVGALGGDDVNYLIARDATTGVVTDTGGVRTYTWTFTITSADVAGIATASPINILAIGVDATGAGIQSAHDATYTVVNGS